MRLSSLSSSKCLQTNELLHSIEIEWLTYCTMALWHISTRFERWLPAYANWWCAITDYYSWNFEQCQWISPVDKKVERFNLFTKLDRNTFSLRIKMRNQISFSFDEFIQKFIVLHTKKEVYRFRSISLKLKMFSRQMMQMKRLNCNTIANNPTK